MDEKVGCFSGGYGRSLVAEFVEMIKYTVFSLNNFFDEVHNCMQDYE